MERTGSGLPDHVMWPRSQGADVPALARAAERSSAMLAEARSALETSLPDRVDAVVFGSIARLEASAESDFDYLVVTREHLPDADALRAVDMAIRATLKERLQLKEPGTSGLFGTWVTAAELYMRIGLEQDTNLTHSRRALLLLESVSIRGWASHRELLDCVLRRYLAEAPQDKPPRFLINDILRYWRTITVDYQAKKLHQGSWGLRYLKMAISRKLLVAGFLAVTLTAERAGLLDALERPALSRLVSVREALQFDASREALVRVMQRADQFADHLADPDFRDEMDSLASRVEADSNARFGAVREIAVGLHDDLMRIFLDDPLLAEKSRRYLLF